MASPDPTRGPGAWEENLAGRLLAAVDRQAVFPDCSCPHCDRRLAVESIRREATLAIALAEEAVLRCPQCGFAAVVNYREVRAYHLDRTITIDGRVVRVDLTPRPSHEVSGLDEAGDIIW